jgi:hypothetical protein
VYICVCMYGRIYAWMYQKCMYACKKLSRYTPHSRLEERRYSSYSFPTLALDKGDWSSSRPDRALPGERTPGTHCTGGWVSPRAGLDAVDTGKFLCLCRGSNPDRPVVQPVVRHCSDWATPVHMYECIYTRVYVCIHTCTYVCSRYVWMDPSCVRMRGYVYVCDW